jgi:hypothetical protein
MNFYKFRCVIFSVFYGGGLCFLFLRENDRKVFYTFAHLKRRKK